MTRRALVTGGSRGIGAAICLALKAQGCEVIAPRRSELDLSDHGSVHGYIEAHKDEQIDILVNNAGINILNVLDVLSPKDWQEMVQVNLTAPLELIRAFSSGMKKAGWGRIVNTASIFGIVTKEGRAAYTATKSGLIGLTKTAAVELAPYGITVNALCPGYVETELTVQNNSPAEIEAIAQTIPAKRLASPEEMAHYAAFLCSEGNTYLTGQTLIVDGGFSCK